MDLFRFEVTGTGDDGDQQTLSGRGLPGEEFVKVARLMPHGLASHAPKGSHGLGVAVNGRRDEVVVLGLEQASARQRNLPEGGTAIYDAGGNVLKFVGSRADLDTGSRPFTIKTGLFTVEASEVVLKCGDMVIRLRPSRIDLGAMTAPNRVATDAGYSSKVYAVI
jgi:phage gp45-like